MDKRSSSIFIESNTSLVLILQTYMTAVSARRQKSSREYTFQLNPPSFTLVRRKSSRTRRTPLRTELNLYEIPVGVPCYGCNVAPVDVSDFQPGISMRRESRLVDACHVVSTASHSCGSALKGRHVMPFSQSLCQIPVKENLDLINFSKVNDRWLQTSNRSAVYFECRI